MVGHASMRELYVTSRMDIGGAERIVLQLCAAAVARGDDVAVASSEGVWVDRVLATGARHHALPRMRRNPLRMAQATLRLRRIIRAERPDVVHTVNVKVTAVARAALGRNGRRRIPVVTSVHGVPDHEYERAVRVLQSVSTRVIACAPAVAAHLVAAGMDAAMIETVTNATALEPASHDAVAVMRERLTADGDARPVVVGVGRLVDQKNWPLWIEVAAAVPDALFVIAGDGPLRDTLEAMSRSITNLALLGRVDDIAALHANADLFLSTSSWEGLPLAMLEAMSLGVPAVVTAVDGVVDAVPRSAAVLVARPDADAIANEVRRVLADDVERHRLAEAGRLVASSPTASEVTEGYARVHRSAIRVVSNRR
jgi:glycosyltransferase involved in cell wall biosynthesis